VDRDRERRVWAGKRALPSDTYMRGLRPKQASTEDPKESRDGVEADLESSAPPEATQGLPRCQIFSIHGGLGVLDGLEDPLAGGDIGRAYFSENQAGVERARNRAFRWASSSANFRMTVGSPRPVVEPESWRQVSLVSVRTGGQLDSARSDAPDAVRRTTEACAHCRLN
jgi:hypothetical protein